MREGTSWAKSFVVLCVVVAPHLLMFLGPKAFLSVVVALHTLTILLPKAFLGAVVTHNVLYDVRTKSITVRRCSS